MEHNVKDKSVIVTGGAQGLGLSIAEKFLDYGAKVVIILDIKEEEGNAAVNELNKKKVEGRAVFIKCDVTKDLEEVSSEIIKVYKTIDVLVNNAGWVREDSVKDTFSVNTLAVIEWCMRFMEHMRVDKGGKGGAIINIASICGVRSEPRAPFYSASKHAVIGFTKSKGHVKTFAKTLVRIVGLCPGATRTSIVESCIVNTEDEEFAAYLKTLLWQDADAVGDAAVEVFRKAESGTVWLIEGGNPITEV